MAVSKNLILELQQIIKDEYGREPSFAEVSEIANGCVDYFSLLMRMDDEYRQSMKFEYPEDEKFFASLLCDGDIDALKSRFMTQFDFRDALKKRDIFNKLKKEIMREVLKSRPRRCELRLLSDCNNDKLVLDHIIPLSSNELNKYIRHMKSADGKKVPSQSFGSNHPSNFLLACNVCNNFKKHRFIKKIQDKYEIISLKK